MKVLLFVRALTTGGTERQLTLLARGLSHRGHDVAVVVLYAGGALEAQLDGTAVRLLSLDKRGRWHVLGPLARLRRLLLAERPDIVYAFLPTQTALAALLMPRVLPARLIFGIRSGGMQMSQYDALSALGYRLEAALSRRADLIVVNAQALRDDAVRRGMPAARIVVVPNGIDTDALRPAPDLRRAQRRAWGLGDDAFVIGMAARLDPMKDHATLLAAAALAAKAHDDIRIVCAGTGASDYRDKLRQQADALGLGERVIWAGDHRDVAAAFNAFDIGTLSSAFGEGFPNVVGEAMACGVPVAATDVGDVGLIVGECGEVVPTGRPDLLCAAWLRLRQRLAAEPGLRAAARARIVERFGIDVMVTRTEAVLAATQAGRLPNLAGGVPT